MKKLISVLLLCSLLFSPVFAEGIDYSALSPEELQQLIDGASAALDEKKPSSEYPRIAVEDLFSAYDQNEAAADLKYTDQLVEIYDNVYKIEKTGNGKYEIGMGDGGLFSSSVICHMKEDQIAGIAELQKGRKAIIRGVCQGDPSWGIIYFDDCEIIVE